MAIFNSYVKLPEGILIYRHFRVQDSRTLFSDIADGIQLWKKSAECGYGMVWVSYSNGQASSLWEGFRSCVYPSFPPLFEEPVIHLMACWWFETFGLFFYSVGNVIIPSD